MPELSNLQAQQAFRTLFPDEIIKSKTNDLYSLAVLVSPKNLAYIVHAFYE